MVLKHLKMVLMLRDHFMGQMCGLLQVTLSGVLVIYLRNTQWSYQISFFCESLKRINWLVLCKVPCLDGGKLWRSIIKRHCGSLSSYHILIFLSFNSCWSMTILLYISKIVFSLHFSFLFFIFILCVSFAACLLASVRWQKQYRGS